MAVLSLGGVALFGVLHALLIVPIWGRLAVGLPRAALAAIGMTWCYSELRSRGRLRPGPGGGLLFGSTVWLGLLPVSFTAAILRVLGVRSRLGWLEPPLDLFLVAVTGAIAGFLLTRSPRGTLAAAACMVGVLAPLNAPFAVELDSLQRQLYLGMLPIYLAGSLVLSVLLGHSSPGTPHPPGGLLDPRTDLDAAHHPLPPSALTRRSMQAGLAMHAVIASSALRASECREGSKSGKRTR